MYMFLRISESGAYFWFGLPLRVIRRACCTHARLKMLLDGWSDLHQCSYTLIFQTPCDCLISDSPILMGVLCLIGWAILRISRASVSLGCDHVRITAVLNEYYWILVIWMSTIGCCWSHGKHCSSNGKSSSFTTCMTCINYRRRTLYWCQVLNNKTFSSCFIKKQTWLFAFCAWRWRYY